MVAGLSARFKRQWRVSSRHGSSCQTTAAQVCSGTHYAMLLNLCIVQLTHVVVILAALSLRLLFAPG